MANGIQARNRIAECVSRAADETGDAELRRTLRALAHTVLADRTSHTDAQVDQTLLRLSEELLRDVQQGQTAAAGLYISRIEGLLAQRPARTQGGKKMGLLKKITSKLSGKSKPTAEEAALSQTDANLFALEKQIAYTSEKRSAEVEKLRKLVEQAAPLERESFEYKQLRGRAAIAKKQIALYEEQINSFFRALIDNQRYAQLVENGQAMQGLSSLLPDPAEADVLLEQLSMDIEDVKDRQEAFSSTVAAYDKRMATGMRTPDLEDDEFDQAVDALRSQSASESAPEASVPEANAPAAASAAGEADAQARALSDAQDM